MAENGENSMLALLTEIKEQNAELGKRIQKLEEKDRDPSPVRSMTPGSPQASLGGNDDDGNEFDEEEDDPNYVFNSALHQMVQGPEISDMLARDITNSLLNEADLRELRDIHDNNPTPANVPSIRVPKMNPEVNFFRGTFYESRDRVIASIQKNVCTGLSILANMMNELKRKKISPLFTKQHQFTKLNECMLMLTETHKDTTLLRRNNAKPLLNHSLYNLCSKTGMVHRETNDMVFDDDMVSQVDHVYRSKRVMKRVMKKREYMYSKNGVKQNRQSDPEYQRGYGQSQRARGGRQPFPRSGARRGRGRSYSHHH